MAKIEHGRLAWPLCKGDMQICDVLIKNVFNIDITIYKYSKPLKWVKYTISKQVKLKKKSWIGKKRKAITTQTNKKIWERMRIKETLRESGGSAMG